VRACQLTPAGETAAAANLGEILADLLLSFSHLRLRKRQAERPPYNSLVKSMIHHNPLTMQQNRIAI